MKLFFSTIMMIVTLCGCENYQIDTSINNSIMNSKSTLLASVQDSIDKYGCPSCKKPFYPELNSTFIKAVDSAWSIMMKNNMITKPNFKYSKDKFKQSLIDNKFTIDSSKDWITASKKSFNERWYATWQKDSSRVELVVNRWYRGHTYNFSIENDKFDK